MREQCERFLRIGGIFLGFGDGLESNEGLRIVSKLGHLMRKGILTILMCHAIFYASKQKNCSPCNHLTGQ